MNIPKDQKDSRSEHRPPVLIFGLDGGSWIILKPAVDEGYMPFLKKVMSEGAWGILESTIPPITPAAWGAFQTGRNPGSTGVFEFSWWDRKTKKYRGANSTCLDRTIWEIFSNAGRSIVALNLPMTYPPKKVNGIMVSGLMTPSMKSEFTYPPEFKKELFENIPNYQIFNMLINIPRKPLNKAQEKKFIHNLVKMLQIRTDAACFLIRKKNWDLFMVHFQATDVLQHQFWKYLDPKNPDFIRDKRDWLLSAFYHELDRRMEHIYKSFQADCGTDPLLIVMSDHGFESHYRRFNLYNWLSEQGYLCRDENLKVPFLTKLVKLFTPQLRRFFSDRLCNKILWKFSFSTIPVIWEKTRAFTCGCSNGDGAIYLLTENETERENLIKKLSQELSAIKDPQTGKPIVRKIYRKEEIYSGERMEQMPDLMLEPEPTYSFTVQYQPRKKLFTTVKEDNIIHRGKHHKDGIIAAMGPYIQKKQGLRLQITDILPTILSYCGLPGEKNLDGKVHLELFEDAFQKNLLSKKTDTPLDTHSTHANTNTETSVYTPEEENLLRQRLKDLGYMD